MNGIPFIICFFTTDQFVNFSPLFVANSLNCTSDSSPVLLTTFCTFTTEMIKKIWLKLHIPMTIKLKLILYSFGQIVYLILFPHHCQICLVTLIFENYLDIANFDCTICYKSPDKEFLKMALQFLQIKPQLCLKRIYPNSWVFLGWSLGILLNQRHLLSESKNKNE